MKKELLLIGAGATGATGLGLFLYTRKLKKEYKQERSAEFYTDDIFYIIGRVKQNTATDEELTDDLAKAIENKLIQMYENECANKVRSKRQIHNLYDEVINLVKEGLISSIEVKAVENATKSFSQYITDEK